MGDNFACLIDRKVQKSASSKSYKTIIERWQRKTVRCMQTAKVDSFLYLPPYEEIFYILSTHLFPICFYDFLLLAFCPLFLLQLFVLVRFSSFLFYFPSLLFFFLFFFFTYCRFIQYYFSELSSYFYFLIFWYLFILFFILHIVSTFRSVFFLYFPSLLFLFVFVWVFF